MTSKLKALGLALLAIGAMSLLAASSSYAANGTVHIAANHGRANVTGTQDPGTQEVFKLTASGAVTQCKDAHYEGTATDSSEPHQQTQVTPADLTVTAIYTECKTTAPIESAATIDTNGCKYTLTPSETETTVTVDIVGCTTGKQIQITTNVGCTIDVPEQNGLSHITLTNLTDANGKEYITAHTTIQGITYQPTGGFCILGQAQHTDGDYEGTQEFKAYEDENLVQEQLTVNGHQFTRHPCGAQVNMFAT